uniref:Uncharacterized protein n=1 Tax=Timema cristinae TaxID=61476 RepID=A0A7R9H425_TIMCR|nr:unnamed protein product [Timema cristinae]
MFVHESRALLEVNSNTTSLMDTPVTNKTFFGFMEEEEEVGFTDMQTVFLACIATLIPLVFILLAGFIVRSGRPVQRPLGALARLTSHHLGVLIGPGGGPHSNLGTERDEDTDAMFRSWTISRSLSEANLAPGGSNRASPTTQVDGGSNKQTTKDGEIEVRISVGFLWRRFHVRKGEGYEGVLQREESSDPLAVKSLSVSGNILPHEVSNPPHTQDEQSRVKSRAGPECAHIRVEGEWKPIIIKTTLSTSDRDSNLDLLVLSSPVYCESCALDCTASDAVDRSRGGPSIRGPCRRGLGSHAPNWALFCMITDKDLFCMITDRALMCMIIELVRRFPA